MAANATTKVQTTLRATAANVAHAAAARFPYSPQLAQPAIALACQHAGFRFYPKVQPQGDEPVIAKTVNSAFIGTDLKKRVDDAGITTLLVAGITTNHCVSTTVRMAGNYGFTVYYVHDACACFDRAGALGEQFSSADTMHRTALANLHGEFARVVSTKEVLQQGLQLPVQPAG